MRHTDAVREDRRELKPGEQALDLKLAAIEQAHEDRAALADQRFLGRQEAEAVARREWLSAHKDDAALTQDNVSLTYGDLVGLLFREAELDLDDLGQVYDASIVGTTVAFCFEVDADRVQERHGLSSIWSAMDVMEKDGGLVFHSGGGKYLLAAAAAPEEVARMLRQRVSENREILGQNFTEAAFHRACRASLLEQFNVELKVLRQPLIALDSN